jgi:hypothetical protein
MGQFYSLSRAASALSTTNDTLTIIAAAARALRIHEVMLAGQGTASAANEVAVARSSAGTTPGGAVTEVGLNPNNAALAATNATTWSVQPTLGDVLLRLGVNANGAINRWVAKPGQEIEVPAATQISIRSISGTSSVSLHVIVEEI